MDTLFSHISVITMDERKTVLTDAYVGVKDGKIAWLSKKAPEGEPRQHVDGRGMVLLPGLINCHTNLEQTMLRGCADDLELREWLEKVYAAMEKMDDRAAKASALLGIAECLRFGVTSVSDLTTHVEAVAEAVSESGIKANIARETTMLLGEEFDFETYPDCRDMVRACESWHGHDNGRILMEAGLQGESTSSYELWEAMAEYAINNRMGLHLNLAWLAEEQEDCLDRSGLTQAQLLNCHNLFSVRTQAAHCAHLDEEDRALLGRKKVSAVCCPASEQKLSTGEGDLLAMVKAGMNVALGTDSAAASGSLDLLRQVRAAAMTTKNAFSALLMGTVCGAKAQGRSLECGMIKEGMDADLIMLDFTQPQLMPTRDLTASVVYTCSGRDVLLTMVRGEILYFMGRYPTIDLGAVMEELGSHMLDD